MGMNPDTGEIKQFPSADEIPKGWIPLSNREARRMKKVASPERLQALQRERVQQALQKRDREKRRKAARARARKK